MAGESPIEWTDATWNPVRGCSRISPGCVNCYAEAVAARFSGPGLAYEGLAEMTKDGPRWTRVVRLVPGALEVPLHWKKPRRIFVNSMSDLFHESLSDMEIERIFAVMALSPQHTFQVLTKRAERMREWFLTRGGLENREMCVARAAEAIGKVIWDARGAERHLYPFYISPAELAQRRPWPGWPLPNVWLGISAEDQKHGLPRLDHLRACPATVRFVSIEPQLEDLGAIDLRGIHWVIVGGESGRNAREFDVTWARSIVKQCADAGVACFVKQIGAKPFSSLPITPIETIMCVVKQSPLRSKKGGDPSEWPEDLRVRQFPEVRRA